MKYIISAILILLCLSSDGQQFPAISQGSIVPSDNRLAKWIDESKSDELTIASFNVRNLGNVRRSFSDYTGIVDYIDESDIVVFQEVGLGLFSKDVVDENNIPEYKAIIEQLKIAFGEEWDICIPAKPSGIGRGREANIVAYKRNCNGYACEVKWDSYIDLGDRRDMPLFSVELSKNGNTQNISLGSVHLKPDDPYRGEEMIKLANWISVNNSNLIIVGDFNWGYRRTAYIENYLGEKRIKAMHDSGTVFQLFYELSYLGKAKANKLRTNMGFRKSGYFYDQILISPDLSDNLADGGEFLKDCGIFAYDLRSGFMKQTDNYIEAERSKGLNKYIDLLYKDNDIANEAILSKTRSNVDYYSKDYTTFFVSDHRIVWVQIDVFDN